MGSKLHKLIVSSFRQKNINTSVVDPVCWMDVAMSSVAGQSEYQGKTYYFCSFGCKAAFDKQPDAYIENGMEEPMYLVENDIFLKV